MIINKRQVDRLKLLHSLCPPTYLGGINVGIRYDGISHSLVEMQLYLNRDNILNSGECIRIVDPELRKELISLIEYIHRISGTQQELDMII